MTFLLLGLLHRLANMLSISGISDQKDEGKGSGGWGSGNLNIYLKYMRTHRVAGQGWQY